MVLIASVTTFCTAMPLVSPIYNLAFRMVLVSLKKPSQMMSSPEFHLGRQQDFDHGCGVILSSPRSSPRSITDVWGHGWLIHSPCVACCQDPFSPAPVQLGAQSALPLLQQSTTLMRRQGKDSPHEANEWSAAGGSGSGQAEHPALFECHQRRTSAAHSKVSGPAS